MRLQFHNCNCGDMVAIIGHRIAVRLRFERDRRLRVNNRIDQERAPGARGDKRLPGPMRPSRIIGCAIDEKVRIDETQSSPRVIRGRHFLCSIIPIGERAIPHETRVNSEEGCAGPAS